MPFEPEEILWKYITSDGESFEKPEEKKVIAPLLLSRGVNDGYYRDFVNEMVKQGFCVAIPCDSETRQEKFRTNTYEFVEGAFFPLSPAQGASQLISAMSNGIDVVDLTGGACMAQKMFLVKDYFRKNPDKIPQQKIRFLGFSDGSSPALYLGDLLQHIHVACSVRDGDQREEFFKALRWSENDFVEKELTPLNEEALIKYNESSDLVDLTPITLTVHNQVLSQNINSFEEWRPKSGQKFVMCIEGFANRGSHAYSINETLERFFARFSALRLLDQLQHLELGEIKGDNSEESEAAIVNLCNHYGVALVAREGQRTGHGEMVFAEPSGVPCSLSFKDGKLVQTTRCIDLLPPNSIENERYETNYSALAVNSGEEPTPKTDSVFIPLLPINQRAEELLQQGGSRKVFGGLPRDVTDMAIDPNKGLLIIVKSNSNHAFTLPCEYAFASGRIKGEDFDSARDAPFVIFAGDFEDSFAKNPQNFQKFIDSNCRFVEKFVSLNEVQTPIFYANQQIKNLPNLFEAQIEMVLQRPASSASQTTKTAVINTENSAQIVNSK